MKEVQPIRSKSQIADLKAALREWNEKYYIMLLIGLNSGLRVSDILKIKVSDVYRKRYFYTDEQKTGKEKRISLPASVRDEIEDYIDRTHLKPEDYIIYSNKGGHINRKQAYKVLNDAAKKCGITERIGTHSMRKTFGYHYYQKYKDITELQYIFNHSSPSVTMRYIGLTQDVIEDRMRDFNL